MSFFFKLFPEIIEDGRLFIAEPPLYRINNAKNPFVINTADYIDRYVRAASKDYKMGYEQSNDVIEYLSKSRWAEFLSNTSSYVEDIQMLSEHYKVNGRLLEMILEEFASKGFTSDKYTFDEMIKGINPQVMMNRIADEFEEVYYDDADGLIKGIVEGKMQSFEVSEAFIRKSMGLINILILWGVPLGKYIVLTDLKTSTDHKISLLGILKILKKYQPNILHRFKGLGENNDEDIKTTIMDPNTRTLIRVNISDIENDMKVFQMLRGNSPFDAQSRKRMMKAFKISKDDIDT